MKLEVLGTGCAKCNALEDAVRKAADELGIDYTLEHVKDLGKIASYGVLMTPGLVVDGEVKVSGKIPGSAELAEILRSSAS